MKAEPLTAICVDCEGIHFHVLTERGRYGSMRQGSKKDRRLNGTIQYIGMFLEAVGQL